MALHPRQPPGGPGRPAGPGGPPPRSIPQARDVVYYEGEKLRPELLDTEAESWARDLHQVAPSQLRRFYDDVTNLRQRLLAATRSRGLSPEQAFEELRADFKMLKAKAVYAHGRSDKTFPHELLQFFIDHVHSVATARDFDAFCKHFQAVLAFHKFYGKEQ
jgi:CRISPR-associated protein Csm2